jgi:orotate phosphoribosyltransferase
MRAMSVARQPPSRQEVISIGDDRWKRLWNMINEHSLMRGDFTLSSGKTSGFLFQLRQTTMRPEGQHLIGSVIDEFMRKLKVRSIGGLEIGAVPVVAAVSHASFLSGYPIDAFFVRKVPKPHGAKERIDGTLENGDEVLLVDDVTTSGNSILKAFEVVEAERNCSVRWALSIVDRDEGAAELLATRGISLASIFVKADFGL